jgi:hypothetical protein
MSNGEGSTWSLSDTYRISPVMGDRDNDEAQQGMAQGRGRTTSVAPTGNGSTRYIFMSYPHIDLSAKTDEDKKTTYKIPNDTSMRAVVVSRDDSFVQSIWCRISQTLEPSAVAGVVEAEVVPVLSVVDQLLHFLDLTRVSLVGR